MKKISATLILLNFLFAIDSFANHFAGADLGYVCLGGNQYRINLNLYVDCVGATPGPQQNINITHKVSVEVLFRKSNTKFKTQQWSVLLLALPPLQHLWLL